MVSPSLVINLFNIVILIICKIIWSICSRCLSVVVANITVVHDQVGSTKDRTTLTTAIGITLNGGNAFIVAIPFGQCSLVFTDTNDYVGFTKDISSGCCRRLIVITYVTFPAATINVTKRTTFYVGCRTGGKTVRIRVAFCTNF